MTLDPTTRSVDALVIGAGFSGLAMLHHLREAGLDTLVVEATDGIGGTWWINNYPGVRTDSEFHYYSFSFSKEVRDELQRSADLARARQLIEAARTPVGVA